MKVTVTENKIGIPLKALKDGQLAVVLRWRGRTEMIGQLVQRYRNIIILVGEHSGQGYSTILEVCDDNEHRVELVPPGSTITLL